MDNSTLRFWQKRGLVPKPVRGPVEGSRGTRGYYDPSLIDRLVFIRRAQKDYVFELDEIREELQLIDQSERSTNRETPNLYQERLAVLQMQHEAKVKQRLLIMFAKALGVEPNRISAVTVRLEDGQTIQLSSVGEMNKPLR